MLWLIRLLFTLYSIGSLIFSIVYYDTTKWPVFLTNWGLVLTTVYFITALFVSGYYMFNPRHQHPPMVSTDIPMYTKEQSQQGQQDQESSNSDPTSNTTLPFAVKFLWAWHQFTLSIILALTILYWILIRSSNDFETPTRSFSYINDHGGLFTLLVIDFCFSKIPIRILHVVYCQLVTILYLIVTIIYNFAANDAVYPGVLDWQNKAGWSAVYVVGGLILLFVVQLIFYGLYRWKVSLKKDAE